MAISPDHSPANFAEVKNTSTGSAITIFTANPARRGVILGNPSDTDMTFRVGAAADSGSIPLPAGTSIKMEGTHTPSGMISLYCASASKAYCCYEW